jgi:hypothetical protein
MCNKCAAAIAQQVDAGISELVGCKEEPRIKNYDDARAMCPLIYGEENDGLRSR